MTAWLRHKTRRRPARRTITYRAQLSNLRTISFRPGTSAERWPSASLRQISCPTFPIPSDRWGNEIQGESAVQDTNIRRAEHKFVSLCGSKQNTVYYRTDAQRTPSVCFDWHPSARPQSAGAAIRSPKWTTAAGWMMLIGTQGPGSTVRRFPPTGRRSLLRSR